MELADMVAEIKVDLGSDVNSLGISTETIQMKIKEALRKISSYAPYQAAGTFSVVNSAVTLPEGTTCVTEVLNLVSVNKTAADYSDDQDLFSARKYLYGTSGSTMSDPYLYLMQINQLKTIENFISLKDWYFDRNQHKLYFSNAQVPRVTVTYLRAYQDLSEVHEELVLQKIKEYALALCKIIEGMIRRKLQSAPGAIAMDGDSLVSEGQSEKSTLDTELPQVFKFLRFGIRV